MARPQDGATYRRRRSWPPFKKWRAHRMGRRVGDDARLNAGWGDASSRLNARCTRHATRNNQRVGRIASDLHYFSPTPFFATQQSPLLRQVDLPCRWRPLRYQVRHPPSFLFVWCLNLTTWPRSESAGAGRTRARSGRRRPWARGRTLARSSRTRPWACGRTRAGFGRTRPWARGGTRARSGRTRPWARGRTQAR